MTENTVGPDPNWGSNFVHYQRPEVGKIDRRLRRLRGKIVRSPKECALHMQEDLGDLRAPFVKGKPVERRRIGDLCEVLNNYRTLTKLMYFGRADEGSETVPIPEVHFKECRIDDAKCVFQNSDSKVVRISR